MSQTTCGDPDGTAIQDYFDVYLKSEQANKTMLASAVKIDKATGKSTGQQPAVTVDKNSGRLQSIVLQGSTFKVLRSAKGSNRFIYSAEVCKNIGLKAVEPKNVQVQDVPIYGNWCGPGYGGSEPENPPAVDGVDRACMRHDLCYDARGYLDCNCDGRLLSELPGESASSPEGEAARVAMVAYFGVTYCTCTKRVCAFGACRNISIPSCCGTCPG